MKENNKRMVGNDINIDIAFKLISLGLVAMITVAILANKLNSRLLQSYIDSATYNSWQVQSEETKNLLFQFKHVLMYDDTSIGGTSETESLRSNYIQFASHYVRHPQTEVENLQNTFILLKLVKIKLNFFKAELVVYNELVFNSCNVDEQIKTLVYYAENLSLITNINSKIYFDLIDLETKMESQLSQLTAKKF
jgi:hypothetical protein